MVSLNVNVQVAGKHATTNATFAMTKTHRTEPGALGTCTRTYEYAKQSKAVASVRRYNLRSRIRELV